MRGRGGTASLAASPVLVGAVTLLVTIVAVFLSYNANAGLPFVPTYDLRAELPNAANLVKGNEVRIGGARVGAVESIEAVPNADGTPTARLTMKLNKELEPLPVDSKFIVRSRSALGLKYVELTPGEGRAGYKAGSTVPVTSFTETVEIDDFLNQFNDKTRVGIQRSLNGFGPGLAGRGEALNEAILELRPLLDDLESVASNLADPETRLARLFSELGDAAAETAPVAQTQAALFGNLATTFGALAGVAPFLQEFISESPPTFDVGIREFPRQRPFLRNSAAFFRELRPGVRTLPTSAPVLADAFRFGIETLPRTPSLNRRLASLFDALADFSDDPVVPRGLRRIASTMRSLRPLVAFLTPVQTRCNYVTLLARNAASLFSEGDRNGTYQRFIVVAAPLGTNSEGGPSDRPASGDGGAENNLHINPYPNTASPGQQAECEAGNEDYVVGRPTIGNAPGNGGLVTAGQEGADASAAGGGRP
ncbi:MAG TPA: MlaD family protein [Thermoleophilaceae bacterium]|nr:MlaD family protein [Thermoleophilaceae bacterium]